MFRDTFPWEEDAGVTHGDASGQVHSIFDGSLEESGVEGEGRDRDAVDQKRIRCRGRAERFIGVLGSDVLLGDFR